MNLVIGDHIKFTLPKFTGGSFSFSGGRRRARGGGQLGGQSVSGRETARRDGPKKRPRVFDQARR